MHISNLNSSQCFESKVQFLNPLGFEGKSDFHHETNKIKSHPTTASKRYLSDKSPTHDREIASIFRFSAESFESDIREASKRSTPMKNNFVASFGDGNFGLFPQATHGAQNIRILTLAS